MPDMDIDENFLHIDVNPLTLTIITTYTCNAACEECCFECTPTVKHRLSFDEIKGFIERSITTYPTLELVVFTGGECFLLKDDLYNAIGFCTSLGLATRCVSNGFWGKNRTHAEKVVNALVENGLSEINFSTGLDHKKWVPVDSVITATECLLKTSIPVLITIEKDSGDSDCFGEVVNDPRIKKLLQEHVKLTIQSNSWMPFHKNSIERGQVDQTHLRSGCDQVFTNLVLTPKREIASCCGLTLEHIPEMRIGDIDDTECYRREQENDFLKLWLRVDGPMNILETLLGRNHEKLKKVVHVCQACAILHKDDEVRDKLEAQYTDHMLAVGHKWNLIKAVEMEVNV